MDDLTEFPEHFKMIKRRIQQLGRINCSDSASFTFPDTSDDSLLIKVKGDNDAPYQSQYWTLLLKRLPSALLIFLRSPSDHPDIVATLLKWTRVVSALWLPVKSTGFCIEWIQSRLRYSFTKLSTRFKYYALVRICRLI